MDTEGRKIPAEYYAASYKNNTKAGKATVTVRFKDGYSGTVKKAFTIRPAGTSIQKLTAASGGFAVKWKKKTAQVSGYQIQYSADKGFKGSSTRSVSVKKASITGKEVKKTESREKILCAHPHLQNGKGGWEKHESILRMERRRPGKDAPGIRREKHSICCPGNDIYRVQMPNSTPHVCRHPYVKHKTKSFLRNSRVFKADFCAPSHSLCTEVFHFPDNINLISGVNIHTFNQCVSQGGI